MELKREDQHTLLNIAEWSILRYLEDKRTPSLPEKFNITVPLRQKCGAFVSIYVKKNLRGCIGTFSESLALYKNVQQMALEAATRDNRFRPVKLNELDNLEIEISVLSPRKKVSIPEDITIGKHGIYLIHGYRRATLLPQVAVKNNWDAVTFLEKCSENKLGLHKDCWKEAELYVYEAFVFK